MERSRSRCRLGYAQSGPFAKRRRQSQNRRRPTAISPAILAQMNPTILLTGKTGQLGSKLNRWLPKLGEVIALDRKDLDLLDPAQIQRVMQHTKPQWIVNAAAYTAVDAAETDQATALAINAEGPRLLALEAKKTGAALVHFSTDYVFDG